jgi:hypothetical protein
MSGAERERGDRGIGGDGEKIGQVTRTGRGKRETVSNDVGTAGSSRSAPWYLCKGCSPGNKG